MDNLDCTRFRASTPVGSPRRHRLRRPSPIVHLLQGFDEYVVGYSGSENLLDSSGAARSLTRDGAIFNGVVIVDSQVAGHWKRTLKRSSAIVEAALYTPFDDVQTKALQAAADEHGEFLGLPATVAKPTAIQE